MTIRNPDVQPMEDPHARLRILVVDDDALIRCSLTETPILTEAHASRF
jgi:hypothetical protein